MGHFDRWEKKMFSDSEITASILGSMLGVIVSHIVGLVSEEELIVACHQSFEINCTFGLF